MVESDGAPFNDTKNSFYPKMSLVLGFVGEHHNFARTVSCSVMRSTSLDGIVHSYKSQFILLCICCISLGLCLYIKSVHCSGGIVHCYSAASACTVVCECKLNTLINSKPRLLNLILLNLIVRLPTERSHCTNNLWNASFGLWKIRIMNGWMVNSFEWKTSKHHKNKELVATLWFYYESFRR